MKPMWLLCRIAALAALLVLGWEATTPAKADNPFGVILGPLPGEGLDMTLARARGLGITWLRPPDVYLSHWNPKAPCPTCLQYRNSGLRLALVVRAQGQDWPSYKPSSPPSDLGGYKASLDSLLDVWKPILVVVEAGENSAAALSNPGTDYAAYLSELDAACAVAHAHKMFCTNGGLSSRSVAAAYWLDLLARGQTDQACDFARRVFYSEKDPFAGQALCAYQTPQSVPDAVKGPILADADKLLARYRSSPIDVVNFHWFIHDARALSQMVDYVSNITGKRVVSSEMGQWNWDAAPAHVRPLLRAAFAAQMQMVLWYSIESDNTASLFGSDGLLRPAGWEFQHQMRGK